MDKIIKVFLVNIKDKSLDDIINHYKDYIKEEDIKKMKRFKFELNQKQSIISSILKNKYVGEGIYYNEHSKPLSDSCYFNISHSNDYIIMAYSKDFSVGIDIEKVKTSVGEDLVNYVCSSDEINHLDKEDHFRSFYAIWAKKEAVLKCEGRGLVTNLKDVLKNNQYKLFTYNLDDYIYSIAVDTNEEIMIQEIKEYE